MMSPSAPDSEEDTQRGVQLRKCGPAKAPEREPTSAPDTDPDSSHPALSVEVVEVSVRPQSTQRLVTSGTKESPDSDASTLLSAPAPASSYEVEVEERLTRLERTVSRLTGRIESLEVENRQLRERTSGGDSTEKPWLLLAGIALVLAITGFLLFRR